jgi:hypothetical protein
LAFDVGGVTGAAVGAGVGGAAFVGAGVGGAALVGAGVGGAALVGAGVGGAPLATAIAPGPDVGPGPPDAAGAEASGVSPGPTVGSVTGGWVVVGSPLGTGVPSAIGGALTDGVGVTRAVWSVGPRDPARPSATVARMMLSAPSARTRRVRCAPVTLDTAPSVGPRMRSND